MELKPFIKGATVDLRPLSPSDLAGDYVNWFNDEEVTKFNSHHVYPYTRELAERYVADAAQQKSLMVLAIVNKEGVHIGNASLQRIDYVSRSAEFAILIGNRGYWGKGIAKEVARLLVAHAFDSLNLNRVYCGTAENNIAMQKVALSLGMKEEGRRRKALFKEGTYVDIVEYGLLRSEYKPT